MFGTAPTLRRRSDNDAPAPHATGPFALYRVAAQLPKDSWGYHFSRAHPNARLELLNRIEVETGQLLVEVRMSGEGADAWPAESKKFPSVVRLEVHPESEGVVLYRVTFAVPSIHTVTQEHRVLTRYPIVIQNGWSRFETFASAPQMRAFLEDLRSRVGPGQIESVRRSSGSLLRLGLSPVQDKVFREALSAGYFAVPRGISVTGLARRLGRSKSSVSVALVKIHRQLADSARQVDLTSFRMTP